MYPVAEKRDPNLSRQLESYTLFPLRSSGKWQKFRHSGQSGEIAPSNLQAAATPGQTPLVFSIDAQYGAL